MTRSGEGRRKRRCGGSVAVLPIDVLDEILCRLPMKSLLRCKSVCQLWYSLIKTPLFISNHYNHQSNRSLTVFGEKIGHKFFRFSKQIPIAFNPAAETYPLLNQGGGIGVLFSYYVGLPWLGILLRPVNGLFLMLVPNVERCRMALLNPATRQFRGLIDFEYQPQQRNVFGYGICKYIYKVVWLNIRPTQRHVAVAKVYTVGENGGWRIINEALPRDFVIKYSPNPFLNISMNGKCYWLSQDFASVLVFDMDEEAFHELNTPIQKSKDVMLSEVKCCGEGDSLALFVFECNFVDMFVMDKEEEWHQIRRLVTCISRPVRDLLDPLAQLEFPITDANILLNGSRNSFALYSPNTNLCMRFCASLIFVFKFKESLVSVDGEIQVSDHVLEDFCTF